MTYWVHLFTVSFVVLLQCTTRQLCLVAQHRGLLQASAAHLPPVCHSVCGCGRPVASGVALSIRLCICNVASGDVPLVLRTAPSASPALLHLLSGNGHIPPHVVGHVPCRWRAHYARRLVGRLRQGRSLLSCCPVVLLPCSHSARCTDEGLFVQYSVQNSMHAPPPPSGRAVPPRDSLPYSA